MFLYLQYLALLVAIVFYPSLKANKMGGFLLLCMVGALSDTISDLTIKLDWAQQNYISVNFFLSSPHRYFSTSSTNNFS